MPAPKATISPCSPAYPSGRFISLLSMFLKRYPHYLRAELYDLPAYAGNRVVLEHQVQEPDIVARVRGSLGYKAGAVGHY